MKIDSSIDMTHQSNHCQFELAPNYFIQSITIRNEIESVDNTPLTANEQDWVYYCRVLKYQTVSESHTIAKESQNYEILFEGWISNHRHDTTNTGIPVNTWYGTIAEVIEGGFYWGFTGITIPINDVVDDKSIILVILNDDTVTYQYNLKCTLNYSDYIFPKNAYYNEEDHSGVWAFCQRYKSVANSKITVEITPQPGTWLEIENSVLLASDWSAAKSVYFDIEDENGLTIASHKADLDNNRLYLPVFRSSADDVAQSPNVRGWFTRKIHYPDYLQINTATLASNELLTILIRAKLHSSTPYITVSAGAIDTTFTDDYEKVI